MNLRVTIQQRPEIMNHNNIEKEFIQNAKFPIKHKILFKIWNYNLKHYNFENKNITKHF